MKVTFAAVGLLAALTGCAGSAERTAALHPVVASYRSSGPPQEVAKCMQSALPGLHTEFTDQGIVLQNTNQFGTVLMAWYISPDGNGSKIDVRRAQKIAPGMKRATRCFEQ